MLEMINVKTQEYIIIYNGFPGFPYTFVDRDLVD